MPTSPFTNPQARPKQHFGGLIAAYRTASAYLELAPDTRRGYQRIWDDWKAINSMPLANIDQVFILGLQERIYKKRGRWLANMVVSVLSVVLSWGVPRGIAESNAAAGIPKFGDPAAPRSPTAPGLHVRLTPRSRLQPAVSGKLLRSPTTLACARRMWSSSRAAHAQTVKYL